MTKKSVAQRIKITGSGKLIRRKMGIGHSLAKKSGQQIQRKRGGLPVNVFDVKIFKKYL